MEGIALLLIGSAIFSHSWSLLGLYADNRTVGVVIGAIGLGLLASIFVFDPQLMGTQGTNVVQRLGEVSVLKTLLLIWAIYAAIVAAQGIWDLEERAVGFYGVILTAGSAVALFYYLQVWISGGDPAVFLPLVVSGALLSIIGGLLFFYYAIPFPVLRAVAGWAMLIESIIVIAIGFGMVTTVVAF